MPEIKLTIDGAEYEMITVAEYNPNYAVPILYREGVEYLGRKIEKEKDTPKPDWEIQSFYYQTRDRHIASICANRLYFTGAEMATLEEMLESSWKIHSVKRLS